MSGLGPSIYCFYICPFSSKMCKSDASRPIFASPAGLCGAGPVFACVILFVAARGWVPLHLLSPFGAARGLDPLCCLSPLLVLCVRGLTSLRFVSPLSVLRGAVPRFIASHHSRGWAHLIVVSHHSRCCPTMLSLTTFGAAWGSAHSRAARGLAPLYCLSPLSVLCVPPGLGPSSFCCG